MSTETRISKPVDKRFQDLTGRRFGRLVVLGLNDRIVGGFRWRCACDCGGASVASGGNLRSGHTTSCGCFERESRENRLRDRKTHGESVGSAQTAEYRIWSGMKNRCANPNNGAFRYYGARGIRVCDRWINSLPNFLADMGRRPGPEYSIDRINNDGNYEPGNCRWATRVEQRRNSSGVMWITYQGETRCLGDWARMLRMTHTALSERLKKHPVDVAFTTPKRRWASR